MSDKDLAEATPATLAALEKGDIFNALISMTPGGIEAQEKQGQQEFVASETLPTNCPREDLEQLGFIFGEAADDIFTYVTFPENWKKVPTEHSMWSDLIDDKNRVRGIIFYKAAFYDRNSHMELIRKFSIRQDYDNEELGQINVYDNNGTVIHSISPIGGTCKLHSREWFEKIDQCFKEAEKWIMEKYPAWKNPLSYWDD